jgi:hypothetical protein
MACLAHRGRSAPFPATCGPGDRSTLCAQGLNFTRFDIGERLEKGLGRLHGRLRLGIEAVLICRRAGSSIVPVRFKLPTENHTPSPSAIGGLVDLCLCYRDRFSLCEEGGRHIRPHIPFVGLRSISHCALASCFGACTLWHRLVPAGQMRQTWSYLYVC